MPQRYMVTQLFLVSDDSKRAFRSLFNVKVGAKIIEFARAVTHSGPTKVRELEISFQTSDTETDIVRQMLNIFQTTCPFYELKWYEL